MKTSNNKLRTPAYFIKRLRDNGFVVLRLFSVYAKSDPRRWTVMINPSFNSVMCTCYANKTELGETLFELDDGGERIPKSYFLKTDSMQVVINFLMKHGIFNGDYPGRNRYYSKTLNNSNEKRL
jgi:hypothetical protein